MIYFVFILILASASNKKGANTLQSSDCIIPFISTLGETNPGSRNYLPNAAYMPGSSLFEKTGLLLSDGYNFKIMADNVLNDNIYGESITVNAKSLDRLSANDMNFRLEKRWNLI